MRRTIAISSLCLAWLCANGAIWDLAQFFAWTRMFSGYAQSLPLGEALRETLDARKPCHLCRAIAKARESQQQHSPQQIDRSDEKLVLALEPSAPVFLSAPPVAWPEVRGTMVEPRIDPVPLPPPRA